MSEILQRWLGTRLGVILDMDPTVFGSHFSDGTLLAQLLHSYSVVSKEQLQLIVPSEDPVDCFNNLRHLKASFEQAGLECDDSTLHDVAEGKGNVAIRLVYQLYLSLENNCRTHFMTKRSERRKRSRSPLRFVVSTSKNIATEEGSLGTEHPLEHMIQERDDLIQWYEDKYLGIIEQMKTSRVAYNEEVKVKLSSEFEEDVAKLSNKTTPEEVKVEEPLKEDVDSDDVGPTYETLMKGKKLAEAYRQNIFVDKEQAEIYLNYLNKRRKNEFSHQAFKLRMQRVLLSELWEKILHAQEKTFDDFIAKKLLKQSQYEKQIATKLLHIRHEKKVIAQNRLMVEKILNDKREEEFNNALIRHREEYEKQKAELDFEHERTMELHRRLYAERLRLKQEENYEICRDVVDAFIDFGVKFSEYKAINEGVVPEVLIDEWKAVFFKSQPIFEVVEQCENLLREEFLEEVGPIAMVELGRQAVMNEHNLEEYLELQGPWDVEKLYPELPAPEGILAVLGYVVHRLLELKYPYPAPPIPADLSKGDVAAVLIGMTDPKTVAILKELLTKRAIYVVTIESVINYCVENYKKEMSLVPDIDLKLVLATKLSMEDIKSKKTDKKKNAKGQKGAKSIPNAKERLEKEEKVKEPVSDAKDYPEKEEQVAQPISGITESLEDKKSDTHERDKQTQTPRAIQEGDEQSITLSRRAELGKEAFETLSLGEQISDNTLTDMIVEYLKGQPDFGGWVVLDYPQTYEQVAKFEVKLSGLPAPKLVEQESSCIEFDESSTRREVNREDTLSDAYNILRESKLLPNPRTKPVPHEFKTYLTAYINARKMDADTASNDEVDFEFCDENTSPLDLLYANEGVNYSFYYKQVDVPTIKKLAKIIIGDMELPPKSSLELFGDVVVDLGSKLTSDLKKSKTATSKRKVVSKAKVSVDTDLIQPASDIPEPSAEQSLSKEESQEETPEKKGKKTSLRSDKESSGKKKNRKEIALVEEPEIQESNLEETGDENKDKRSSIQLEELEVEVVPPKPGEEGWEYANQSLPEGMQMALATLWENVEKVYIEDFKEVFFMQRVHNSTVLPYVNFVTDSVREFIRRPDNKQETVLDFQTRFNDIDEDLRQDVEIKSELHCRVSELQHALWELCDVRMRAAEDERRRVIADNWLTWEMCALANIFMCAAQLELDRCVDTTQMLHDYYLSMLGKLPAEERLEKLPLPRMDAVGTETLTAADASDSRSKRTKSETGSSVRTMIRDIIYGILANVHTDKATVTPFHTFVADSVRMAFDRIEAIQRYFKEVIAREDDSLNPKSGVKKKDKGTDKAKKAKGKGKVLAMGTGDVPETDAVLRAQQEANNKLIQEWETAILTETSRAHYRLQVLNARAMTSLSELQNRLQDVFYRLHYEIGDRYRREVESVDLLCVVLCNAIEEEVPIQEELVLQDDKFFVRMNVLLYPVPPPPTPPPLEERILSDEFRIKQLGSLREKFVRMAPSGVLPERAFVLLLEDLVACTAEEGDGRLLPDVWSELSPFDVQNVVEIVFGAMEYIDWRDFIVYGLDLPYPTTKEILEMRDIFRSHDPENTECITFEDFGTVPFWFLKNLSGTAQQKLRMYMASQFLFTLFQEREDATNYTAMLLTFCKDVDPTMGLIKALTLATGQTIERDEEKSDVDVEVTDLTEQNDLKEEAMETADLIMQDMVEDTVQKGDGLTIEEVFTKSIDTMREDTLSSVGEEDTEEASAEETVEGEVASAEETVEGEEGETASEPEVQVPPPSTRLEALPFDVTLALLTACLPWHAKFPSLVMGGASSLGDALEQVYKDIGAVNKCVPPMAFLKHPLLVNILKKTHKFSIYDLREVVRVVVSNRLDREKVSIGTTQSLDSAIRNK